MEIGANIRFFDGQQSQPHKVKLELAANSIKIIYLNNSNLPSIEWPYHDLLVVAPPDEGRPAIFGCRTIPGARIVITSMALYKQILPKIPRLNIKHAGVNYSLAWLTCLVIFSIGGMLWGIPAAAPLLAKLVPFKYEDKLGQYVIENLAEKRKECINPEGKRALSKLIDRLTTHAEFAHPFDVRVIQTNRTDINAFTAPGYHIIILSGLLDFVDYPEELAGIMAHEMGHARERHPTQALIRVLGIKFFAFLMFGSSADFATSLLNLRHTRENEHQADVIASELLFNAHISLQDLINIFKKILAHEGDLLGENYFLNYFSDHPAIQARINYLQTAPKAEEVSPMLTPHEWQALKNICRQTTPLEFSSPSNPKLNSAE